jgi:hypothetical protein
MRTDLLIPWTLLPCLLACSPSAVPDTCRGAVAAAGAQWQVLDFQKMPNMLFGVWGRAANDVWTVGATHKQHPEYGAQLLHWDGKAWTRHKTPAEMALMWVSPGQAPGSWWLAGAKGQIVRMVEGQQTLMQAPNSTQLWGIFEAAPDAIYAVGGYGSCVPGECDGVIWRSTDGKTWQDAGVPESLRRQALWWKVWARSGKDVWVVGGVTGATSAVLHFDGQSWSKEPVPTFDSIFTLHGNDRLLVAVGGGTDGILLENDGTGFKKAKIQGIGQLPGLGGVFVPADGNAIAVGRNGLVLRRCDGTWERDTSSVIEAGDFLHAGWRGADGSIVAVGGAGLDGGPPFVGGEIAQFGAPAGLQPPP